MERGGRAVATFFSDTRPVAGELLDLGAEAAHHARVRRLEAGSRVRVVDGQGSVATGVIESATRSSLQVAVEDSRRVPPPAPLELFIPVADRDRMLWLAEKVTELGVTAIHPLMFTRSRSVAGRGEGVRFAEKLTARMRGAIEQSGNPWLPELHRERPLDEAAPSAGSVRLLLDAGGAPLRTDERLRGPVAIILGPEGGLEAPERELLLGRGWEPVSVGTHVLRFETAATAAVAVASASRVGEIHGD